MCRHRTAVIAAVLHDVLDDTSTEVATLDELFGSEVVHMLVKVSKLSQINQLLRRDKRKVGGVDSCACGLAKA